MNDQELEEWVKSISLRYFNKPFKHQATFNHRLRTTGGRYHLSSHNLDFNPKVLNVLGVEIFVGIIKHELCHYHLHLDKKGYQHGDKDFKELLGKVGGLRYTPSLESQEDAVLRWVYSCQGCESKVYRKRRFNVNKFVCASCKQKFQLNGREKIS